MWEYVYIFAEMYFEFIKLLQFQLVCGLNVCACVFELRMMRRRGFNVISFNFCAFTIIIFNIMMIIIIQSPFTIRPNVK